MLNHNDLPLTWWVVTQTQLLSAPPPASVMGPVSMSRYIGGNHLLLSPPSRRLQRAGSHPSCSTQPPAAAVRPKALTHGAPGVTAGLPALQGRSWPAPAPAAVAPAARAAMPRATASQGGWLSLMLLLMPPAHLSRLLTACLGVSHHPSQETHTCLRLCDFCRGVRLWRRARPPSPRHSCSSRPTTSTARLPNSTLTCLLPRPPRQHGVHGPRPARPSRRWHRSLTA